MMIWSWCEPAKPKVPKAKVLTTEFLISEALDLGLISDLEAAELISNEHFYPTNWGRYNPNIYIRNKLSNVDRTRFFLALMKFHTLPANSRAHEMCMRRIMYLPTRGQQYKQMLTHFK
jgi:hypothetical protein